MRSKNITIFEGPDGSGKSTAAKKFAKLTNAKYVHFPALPRVNNGLARMYVEAMLPAILGYQDVVLDRCWLSELVYGIAFRNGRDRLTDTSCRMLERLAMRCGAVVVWCDPGWPDVERTFLSRKEDEMLDNTGQLKFVYEHYQEKLTYLPYLTYAYNSRDIEGAGFQEEVKSLRMECHDLNFNTAGNLDAKIILVGEKFPERKDHDPWYQWPYASFDKLGTSQWLAGQIDSCSCSEAELLWLNSDMNLEIIHGLKPQEVIALGSIAQSELYKHKINSVCVASPSHHRMLHSSEHYSLLDYL